MTGAARPRLRRFLALATDNWPARGYLAVVAASLGFFLHASYLAPDPGFAAVVPLLTTAPLGALGLAVPAQAWDSSFAWVSPLLFTATGALAGLVNAALLGTLARGVRARLSHPAA
ncbi:SCO4225 family membrane protein [Streptomyces sp. JNUCC 64]